MSSPNPKCSKCQSPTEEGFILDKGDGNSSNVSHWVSGSPDKRWWGTKTGDKVKLEVITFRCTRCGYLESYTVSPQA